MKHAFEKSTSPLQRIGIQLSESFLHESKEKISALLSQQVVAPNWICLSCAGETQELLNFMEKDIGEPRSILIHMKNNRALLEGGLDMAGLNREFAEHNVQQVVLFNKPNLRETWPQKVWQDKNFIGVFSQKLLELAESVESFGMHAIFPPLEPGGDYWDTSFLRSVLEHLESDNNGNWQQMMLSAYARCGNRSLNWGKGGPEVWPSAVPYNTPENTQDQRGFHIFEWYQTIARAVTNSQIPIILFDAGYIPKEPLSSLDQQKINAAIVQNLLGELMQDPVDQTQTMAEIPDYVPSVFFRIDTHEDLAVFIKSMETKSKNFYKTDPKTAEYLDEFNRSIFSEDVEENKDLPQHTFDHYLLLPAEEFISDMESMEILQPYILRYKPVIGFSLEEAKKARIVSVVFDAFNPCENKIQELKKAGCEVRKIRAENISKTDKYSKKD